ncbi:MAG: ATP-binding cassette domain-containing protein [Prevotellaceae bacterium]|jgi:cell division transport system ATP-binding protein|nr:ATP-binding cassette domain-containing protein [Prevotellaceae bacterium]
MDSKYIIDFRNVSIFQGSHLILKEVTLQVEPGEWVYFIGKVGSGKTSLIRAIHGELPVEDGHATVAGFDLLAMKSKYIPRMRRKMGVVFQDFQLLHDRPVYDNLLFVLRATGWRDKKLINERITKVLEAVELKRKAKDMPHQLSGGEQQRIAIARALLNNPELIIADEPTGNLDSETATDIMKILLEIHRREGPAVIMVTHNQTILKNYPARTLRCDRGRLLPVENSDEIDFNEW